MPRKKAPAEPKGRRRKPAAAENQTPLPTPAPEFAPDEKKYAERYPGHRFVPGSLSQPGVETCFGRKRVITILCASCDAERVIATSDIFHCRLCAGCAKTAKKEARKAETKKGVSEPSA